MELVKKNPYCLMGVDKISFSTADAIAQKQGVPPNSTGRIAGAIKHTLEESLWGRGHCYLMMEELVTGALKLLNHRGRWVNQEQVEAIVKHLSAAGRLVLEAGAVYLPKLHQAEVALAKKIRAILAAPKKAVPQAKVENIIKQYEFQEGIRLDDEQKQIVIGLFTNNLMVMTGGPGVSKTKTIRAAKFVHEKLLDEEIYLSTPTGKASRRLSEVTGKEAVTLYRRLGISQDSLGPTYNKDNPFPPGLQVIDEGSMMGVRIAQLFFDAVANNTRVLLVGDADQLPSVEPGNVLSDLLEQECQM